MSTKDAAASPCQSWKSECNDEGSSVPVAELPEPVRCALTKFRAAYRATRRHYQNNDDERRALIESRNLVYKLWDDVCDSTYFNRSRLKAGLNGLNPEIKGRLRDLRKLIVEDSMFGDSDQIAEVLDAILKDEPPQFADEFAALHEMIGKLNLPVNQARAVIELCKGKGTTKLSTLKEIFEWRFSLPENNWDSLARRLNIKFHPFGWHFFRCSPNARVEKCKPRRKGTKRQRRA